MQLVQPPPKRILIVEDEAVIARDLHRTLEELGYVVVGMAMSSSEAIQMADERHPDLLLMDIRLPGGPDGIETASRIRERHPVPVIYLSANTDPQTLDRALRTSPGGYLAKPYDARTIHMTIEVALRGHATETELRDAYASTVRQTVVLESEVKELGELATRLGRDSTIDALTGLYNRRHFEATLKRELTFARRNRIALGLILLDLDHFKVLNDAFGHIAGDAVLRSLGEFLRAELRPYDTACRYGGEEFVILVPAAPLGDSSQLAERLCRRVAALPFASDGVRLPPVTASFGVAVFPDHGEDELLRAADAALYEAKGAGRSRVVIASR